MEGELCTFRKDLRALGRFVECPTDDPVLAVIPLKPNKYVGIGDGKFTDILIKTLDLDEVCGAPMSPPKLPGDTPVLDTLKPSIPFVL